MPVPKGYRHRKLGFAARSCDPRSFRRIRSGKALVTICCPRGEWMPRKHRCKVGTRATGLDKPFRGFAAFGAAPAGMKVRKDPDFAENGQYIVSYAGQTFRIYFDTSISRAWSFAHPPGVRAERYGDDLIAASGNRNEVLTKLKERIDRGDPEISRFRFGGLSSLARGARKEGREHPWASKLIARRITRDHLLENPRAYGRRR